RWRAVTRSDAGARAGGFPGGSGRRGEGRGGGSRG
ncbi:MarR family transcriptional regulator, partial [Sphingomonas koreensis]